MQFGVDIPQTSLDAIEARAHRLVLAVDRAVGENPRREVREAGGQLTERILEWLEEIKDLREVGDEDAVEMMKSFRARLKLAEATISTWPTEEATSVEGRRAKKRRRREPRAA